MAISPSQQAPQKPTTGHLSDSGTCFGSTWASRRLALPMSQKRAGNISRKK